MDADHAGGPVRHDGHGQGHQHAGPEVVAAVLREVGCQDEPQEGEVRLGVQGLVEERSEDPDEADEHR